MWRPGSKLTHPFNPELGVGLVRAVEDRFLSVYFPRVEREMTLAAEGSGLERLVLRVGELARVVSSGEVVVISEVLDHAYRLDDGRQIDDADLWPIDRGDSPVDKLAEMRVDPLRSFRNRLSGLDLLELREAGGLGSFLGGRIELFPHQLYTALQAVERDPVRWLLADEVGLGKTIEACLILSALLRTGRASRALIVAPDTLTVQWLGELYRKFHQIFVLLDRERIEAVASDFGPEVNPFDVHPFGVIDIAMLSGDPALLKLALAVDLDLVVVDEAHRLSDPATGAKLAPLVSAARHALLLTATPLQADREGFYRLISQLHPDIYTDFEAFERAVDAGEAVVPCTSAVRRDQMGGLPPRVAAPVDLGPLTHDVSTDPRARWIADQVRDWLSKREKALIFVHDLETLLELKDFLEKATQTHITVFHEDLSAGARDIEVARFRETNAPVLLCSEAGSEGRNFQFCERMIHYDLPWDPVVLEQRIGRLDRIGRTRPVEIVYFRSEGARPDIPHLYERLDLFERPAAGLDAALAGIEAAIATAVENDSDLDTAQLLDDLEESRHGSARATPRVFYSDAYDPSKDESILGRVPDDLEEKTRKYSLGAARDLGLRVVDKVGVARFYLEFGRNTNVDSLPGVPEEARYLGTFDRGEALRQDEIDFFASGHPLVEGLLLELEDGARGRATLFDLEADALADCDPAIEGGGLFCVYKDGASWSTLVVDVDGTLRPDWGPVVLDALPGAKRLKVPQGGAPPGWSEAIRDLYAVVEASEPAGKLTAAAFFRVR
jgi:ATP-dependent helicase HepA